MKDVNYLVIGAGPAGLQMGYCFEQSGEDYLIVERGSDAGTFFKDFPRHRQLISINKRFTGSSNPDFNMRHDWNSLWTEDGECRFTDYDKQYFPGADSLVDYLKDFRRKYALNISFDTDIVSVSKKGSGYLVESAAGEQILAKNLIIGTGLSSPLVPDIKGIEYSENYWDMSTRLSDYQNQRILIIGKGNSGFETADHLVPTAALIHIVSPNSIKMAWKTHYVGHLRAVNNNFLDTYQLKSQNAVIDAEVRCIEMSADGSYEVTFEYKHAQGEVEKLSYDRILCCAGFKIQENIFGEGCRPELVAYKKYPQLTVEFESVSCPNMFFIGTLTHSLDYRKTTSGFIHGFRYNVLALKSILDKKNGKAPLPTKRLEVIPETLSKYVLNRTNTSGALWQQPGYLADYFYLDDEGRAVFGEQLPIEYIKQHVAKSSTPTFTSTLEYGDPIEGDPFCVERIHRENVSEARNSQFLHPVIRCFKNGECIDEHHVLEDLESRWVERVHIDPLAEFLGKYFATRTEIEAVVELEA